MSPSQMRKHSSYESFRWNGIDRIDSAKGYVEGNVVPCCKFCNEMKSDKSRDEFLQLIAAIYQHTLYPLDVGGIVPKPAIANREAGLLLQ